MTPIKRPRMMVPISSEDQSWLQEQADHEGIPVATLAGMLIRRARLGASAALAIDHRVQPLAGYFSHAAPLTAGVFECHQPADLHGAAPDVANHGGLEPPLPQQAHDDEPRAEDMDIPADPDDDDLGTLLSAGSGLLDNMAAQIAAERSAAAQPQLPAVQQPDPRERAHRLLQAASARRRPSLQPSWGPGSKTRPVGINQQVLYGNVVGDGFGNVLRDNMGHFGAVGTRAR